MHDVIGPQLQRLLEDGRGDGVVTGHADAGAVGDVRDGADVADAQLRVGGRFQQHQPGLRAQGRGDRLRLRHVDEARRQTLARHDFGHDQADAVVEHVGRDDVIALAKGLQQGVDRRGARGEGRGCLAALQRGDARFQRQPVGVAEAAVDIAQRIAAVRRALVGGGKVHRRDDGAAARVYFMAGVDGLRFKLHDGFLCCCVVHQARSLAPS